MQLCPTQERLSDYVLGKLPVDQSDSITDHLKVCEECLSRVDAVDALADSMVRQLRNPQPDDHYMLEPQCTQIFSGSQQAVKGLELGELREYKMIKQMGKGGMGTVYSALHTKLDRLVAVKLLPTERIQHTDAVSRFEREMKAIGKLDHPNIVRAHDAGESDGQHFLVMELVQGIDLSALAKQTGKMSVSDACEIIRHAASGLQHAHEHDLVHRDIKPSNLMLTTAGNVKILDLGLARLHDAFPDDHELTSTGQIMGTLDYMAPEQLGDSREVDIRADIYSLGATLYKLLTGRAPYADKKYNTPQKRLMAIATKPVAPVGDFRDDVPDALVEVLDRMLAKNPDDRFASAADVAEAVTEFRMGANLLALVPEVEEIPVAELASSVSRESTIDPVASSFTDTLPNNLKTDPAEPISARFRRRHEPPRSAYLLAAGFFFLVAAAAVFFLKSGKATLVVEINDKEVEAVIKQGGQIEVRDLKSGQPWTIDGPGEKKLKPGSYLLRVTDSTGVELYTEKFVLKRGGREIATVTIAEHAVADSGPPNDDVPSGPREPEESHEQIADDRRLIVGPKGRSEPSRMMLPEPIKLDAREPLSKMALVTRPAKIPGVVSWTVDTTTGRGHRHHEVIRFSPDGKLLAVGDSAGTIRLRDTKSGDLIKVLVGHDGPIQSLAFAPNESLLASASHDRAIAFWDTKSGQRIKTLRDAVAGFGQIALHWRPDGASLMSFDAYGMRRWDPTTSAFLQVRHDTDRSDMNAVAWSSSGDFAASGGESTIVTIWDLRSEQLKSRKLHGHRTPIGSIVWSPDGTRLASGDNESVRIWDVASGSTVRSIETIGLAVAWSPSGNKIVAGDAIWDASSGERLQSLDDAADRVVAWSPKGDDIAGAAYFGRLKAWNAESGERTYIVPHHPAAHPTNLNTNWLRESESLVTIDSPNDSGVHVWNVNLGTLERRIKYGGRWPVLGNLMSSDDIVAFENYGVEVVNVRTEKLRRLFDGQVFRELVDKSSLQELALSSDMATFASRHSDRMVRLWDVTSGELKNAIPVDPSNGWGKGLVFSPNNKLLAQAHGDKITLIECSSGKKRDELQGHEKEIRAAAWRPDGTLMSFDLDNVLRVWSVDSGESLRTIPLDHWPWLDRHRKVSFSHDGQFLSLGGSGAARVTDVNTSRSMTFVALRDDQYLAVSDDGHYRGSPWVEKHIVYVVQREDGQDTLTPDEFASRYGWKNEPETVGFSITTANVVAKSPKRRTTPTTGESATPLETGQPMSSMALVSQPATIEELKSWSIETVALRGHAVSYTGAAMAISPNNILVAVGTDDGVLRCYDSSSGRLVHAWLGHEGRVIGVAWSADSALLASTGVDSKARVWNLHSRQLDAVFETPGHCYALAWSPVERLLAVGQSHLSFWFYGNKPTEHARNVRNVQAIAWSHDGKTLAIGSTELGLRFWSRETRQILKSFDTPEPVRSLSWSPDGKAILTGEDQHKLWDSTSGKLIRSLGPTNGFRGLAWSPDSTKFAVAGRDPNNRRSIVACWDRERDQLEQKLFLESGAGIASVAWSADGHAIAVLAETGLSVFDMPEGKLRFEVEAVAPDGIARRWKPNANQIVCAAKYGGKVQIWDLTSGLQWRTEDNLPNRVFRWSPNGRYLAVGGDRLVSIVREGRIGLTLECPSGVQAVAWAPSGTELAVAGNGQIQVWNLRSRLVTQTLSATSDVTALAWAPSESLISGCRDGKIQTWNPESGKSAGELKTDVTTELENLEVSPDGLLIAGTHRDTTIRVWDIQSRHLKHTLNFGQRIGVLSWFDDGKTLGIFPGADSLHESGIVAVWDTFGDELFPREFPQQPLFPSMHKRGALSPRGDLAAVGSVWNSTRWICDVESGTPLCSITELRDGQIIQISPDGHYMASDDVTDEIVYVAETDSGERLTLRQEEFEQRFNWKNEPERARVFLD